MRDAESSESPDGGKGAEADGGGSEGSAMQGTTTGDLKKGEAKGERRIALTCKGEGGFDLRRDWGGEVAFVQCSGKTGEGMQDIWDFVGSVLDGK